MKITCRNNTTLIFPFLADSEEEIKEYHIVIEKGKFTLVDGRKLSIKELKNLAEALNEAVLRVESFEME